MCTHVYGFGQSDMPSVRPVPVTESYSVARTSSSGAQTGDSRVRSCQSEIVTNWPYSGGQVIRCAIVDPSPYPGPGGSKSKIDALISASERVDLGPEPKIQWDPSRFP